MVLGSSGWLLANLDMKGFYRVNYDWEHWERLLAVLTSRPQVLTCCSSPGLPLLLKLQSMSVFAGHPADQPRADHGRRLQPGAVRPPRTPPLHSAGSQKLLMLLSVCFPGQSW